MFVGLVQHLIITGEDCLKTQRRQERFHFFVTMIFIAESVAQCGLKTAAFSLLFNFFPRRRTTLCCLLIFANSFAVDSDILYRCGVLGQSSDND